MSDSVGTVIKDGLRQLWQGYHPLTTEYKGLIHVVYGVQSLAYGIFLKCRLGGNSDRDRIGISTTSLLIDLGIAVTAKGIMELTLPITAVTAYGIYRNWNWI